MLKTIAFGGVEIGNIKLKPTQMVAISITRLCIWGSKKPFVEAKMIESKIAISAVELINILKVSTSRHKSKINTRIGKLER